MVFSDWKRERFIRRILVKLSRQRVRGILQPGNVWVVEKAVRSGKGVDEALRTCHLRGWIEPLVNALPQGELTEKGELPEGDIFNRVGPVYRLTEAGWHVIRQTHYWVVATFLVAAATFVTTILAVIIALNR